MVKGTAIVKNFAGIHVRPSGIIIEAASKYTGNISVSSKEMEADLKNIMGLIAMGLVKDDKVEITVSGPNEETVLKQIVELFETNFDFPPRE